MTKLRKIDVRIQELGKLVEAHLGYSEKKFHVELSPEFADYGEALADSPHGKKEGSPFNLGHWRSAGKNRIGVIGNDEDTVVSSWKNFVADFYLQTRKVEKVILYRVSFSSISINDEDSASVMRKRAAFNQRDDRRHARDADSDENAAKVLFDFMCPVEKRTLGGNVTYFYTDFRGQVDRVADRWNGDWIEVPYTEEGEAFFTSIYVGLETIMDKLSKFVGNAKKAELAIKSSQRLLA